MSLDKKTVMSLFIAFIMIVSVIGFSLSFSQPAAEQLQYKEHKFVRTSQGLRTKLNDINVYFYSFPRDIEEIEFDEGAKTALDGARVVWMTYDPQDEKAAEIADTFYYMEEILGRVADVYVMRGLINNTGYQLAQVTCANASTTVPVIVFRSGNETRISHSAGCITAAAWESKDVYRAGDRILYQALGVMD
jgi:hypothetical protein